MNRVVFLNRFYWPEEPATAQLLADLAESLAAGGRHVQVLTSHTGESGLPAREARHGVEIVRLRSWRPGGRGAAAKAIAWAAFSMAALWWVAWNIRQGDTLVLLTDPPLLAAAVAGPARWRGARVIHWVQDIYPELPMALGARGVGWLRIPRDRAWRHADACVVPGDDMGDRLRGRGTPAAIISTIPNWGPKGLAPAPQPEINAVREIWGMKQKFVVGYSGNLGRVHDLDPVLDLAESLKGDPDLAFLFIGDGAQRSRLEAMAKERALPNVHFLPAQPRERLAASLGAGDVHLVTLRADCAQLVFPSKLYGIAAVGRPVLFIGPPDCEPARQVTQGKFGAAFSRESIEPMATTLRAWRADSDTQAQMGRAALAFAEQNGRFASAATQWEKLLAELDRE